MKFDKNNSIDYGYERLETATKKSEIKLIQKNIERLKKNKEF